MKIDRLMGILTTLMQCDSVTAPQLAEKFEVTRRTIGRDIEALCMAGIPVVTRQGGSGGISLAQGYRLNNAVLTRDELQTLLAALKGIGSVSTGARAERMLEKISKDSDAVVSLRESMVIDLASHYKTSLQEKVGRIRKAIAGSRLIAFDYYSEKGHSCRRVEPYCIVFQWAAWYVFGYCMDRQDFRLFKLNRLLELSVLNESFTPREIPPDRRDFSAGFPDEHRVTILFHPSAKYQLIDTYGPDCFSQLEDGTLRFEFGYTNRAYMVGWILSFGHRARVISPQDMAVEIRDTAKKMVEAYNEHDMQLSCSLCTMEEKRRDTHAQD